jgi:ABC-type phosphate/phosphonate transport system substrate-binding protein
LTGSFTDNTVSARQFRLFFQTDPGHTMQMTKLLEEAVLAAQNLPPEMQDDIARIMLNYAGNDEQMIELSPEEEADLIEAQAEMARGEFATEIEVRTILSKYHL